MWTRIIKYENFIRFGVHLGAKVEDSSHHLLDSLLLGERRKRYVFRLDKILLNYFFNRNLISKISSRGGNFLFLTARREYYDTLRASADSCSQTALLWNYTVLSNLAIRLESIQLTYETLSSAHLAMVPSVLVLFDNNKFRSKRIVSELSGFLNVPLMSVLDTDSIVHGRMIPILGNDDSSVAIYFYSFFIAHTIILSKIGNAHSNADFKKKKLKNK